MFVITYKKIFLAIAGILMGGSLLLIGVLGLPLGIDFTGGSLTEVAYETRPAAAEVEAVLAPLALGSFSLRATTDEAGRAGFLLRTRDLSETERQQVETSLGSVGEGAEVTRFTSIGPVIGQELRDKAAWAIGAVIVVIVLYVAFVFSGVGYPVGSWVYGGITILVLIHDIVVPAALMSLLGVVAGTEVDVLFVMAVMAILGYSVNDTIVVFDRVRELLKEYTKITPAKQPKDVLVTGNYVPDKKELLKPFDEIVGLAITQTLARSLNTSLTTFLALVAPYFLGGEVTQTFALVLMAGVVAGTYSSICIANPLLALMAERILKNKEKQV